MKRPVFALTTALLIIVATVGAKAATPLRTDFAYAPSFEQVSVKQGLAQSTVHVTVQDQLGFIWFATDLGLNRYDGYRFLTFKREEEKPNSLLHNIVRTLLIDQSGTLWVGTFKGLNRIDPETLAIEAFSFASESDGPTQIEAMAEGLDGAIWLGGVGGLYRLPKESKREKRPRFEAYLNGTPGLEGAFPGGVESLYCDAKGTIWIGSRRGVYRARASPNDSGPQFQPFRGTSVASTGVEPEYCRALMEDDSGDLWIGCFNGLFKYEAQRNTVARYVHDPADPATIPSNIVMAIHRDRAGEMWIGNDGAGLARMLPRKGNEAPRFLRMRHDPADPQSLSGNGIQHIFEDRSGVLWVSAYQAGLNKLVLSPTRKEARERPIAYHFRSIAADPASLSGDTVSAMAEDQFGNLWIGTDGFGLNRVVEPSSTDERIRFQRFRAVERGAVQKDALHDDVILALHLDSRKRLWLGTYTNGLVRVDLDSPNAEPRFTHFRHEPENPDSIGDDFIRCILDDGQGRLWLCTNKSALNLFDPESGKAKRIALGKNGHPGMWSGNEILSVVADAYQTLWIATSEGLVRYRPETDEARGYVPAGPGTVASASILTLHVDREGVLWVGTNGGGLSKTVVPPWNGPAPSFTRITTKNGLPSDVVKNIVEDEKGQLWLSTDRALSRLDVKTSKASPFPFQRELAESEYISNSSYRSANGEIYFGSNNGFAAFHPKDVRYNANPPIVAISDFQVLNRSTPLKSRMLPDHGAGIGSVLTLNPADTVIAFDFSALHFVAPERNRYSYMMVGLDRVWTEASVNHFVSYTTLPPGEYEWRARAFNCDNVQTSKEFSLRIRVLPPWYHAVWFRGVLAAALAGLVYGVYRLRVSVLRVRNAQLEAMVVQRTQELSEATRALEELALIDGRFRALFKLGEGGMAEVLLAAAIASGGYRKLVVLKCLRLQLAADREMCDAFIFEARLMASMNHPNVVQILELVDTDPSPIIVMEYLEGKTLAQVIASTVGQLPLALHLLILCEVLEGLDYVHTLKDLQGVPLELVHRDISPDNVMVTYEGNVKLLDFGIAKSSALRRENKTSTGILKGKLHYMAPEQLAGAKVDCRTDLFAAGVMLWEALAGRRIWADVSETNQMRALINGEFPSLRDVRPDLPESCYALIERTISLEVDGRISSAREFKNALLECISALNLRCDNEALKKYMSIGFAEEREEAQKRVLRRVESDPRTWSEAPPATTTRKRRMLWNVPKG